MNPEISRFAGWGMIGGIRKTAIIALAFIGCGEAPQSPAKPPSQTVSPAATQAIETARQHISSGRSRIMSADEFASGTFRARPTETGWTITVMRLGIDDAVVWIDKSGNVTGEGWTK